MIKYSIFSNIIQDPIQCNKCQRCFCSECIKKFSKCPNKCENTVYIHSLLCKQLIS